MACRDQSHVAPCGLRLRFGSVVAQRTPRPGARPTSRRRESGAAAVEFALVLPVLVLVLGAIIDFGFVFAQQMALNNAARDAARAGVVQSLGGQNKTCGQIAGLARTTVAGTLGIGTVTKTAASVAAPGASCTVAGGSTSVVTSGPYPSSPCSPPAVAASPPVTTVRVTLTNVLSPPLPIPFLSTITLSAKGEFQCEYA